MRHPTDKAESRFNTDTGISKEDEERYKKLVLENEELQKLIAQVRMTNGFAFNHSLFIYLINFSYKFSYIFSFLSFAHSTLFLHYICRKRIKFEF